MVMPKAAPLKQSDEPRIGGSATGIQNADAQRERSDRYALLLRSAKLVTRDGEFVCLLRDVSSGGAKARLFHPLASTEGLHLQLANGDSFAARLVWENDLNVGLQFEKPVDVRRLLRKAEPHGKRPIRLKMAAPASVVVDGISYSALLKDLSQQGAQIECSTHLAIDQQIRFEVRTLPAIYAKVRWRRDAAVGLVFEQVFRLDEFARKAAELQRIYPGGC